MSDTPVKISASDARRLAIASQGLHSATPFGKGKEAVYRAIEHLGYVQIDTISVAERAHHHVLWSRAPDYKQMHLHELQLKDKRVLEFWAHAAAYLPMKDYRFALPTMEIFRNNHDPWPKADQKLMQQVLERIRKEGPLMSRHFEHEKKNNSGWWDWKPAKLALQRLFFAGDIMVSHREGFQRVYDIAEKVIPPGINTNPPTTEEYAEYLITSTIKANGLARIAGMHYLRRGMRDPVRKKVQQLSEEGKIILVHVKGVEQDFYSFPEFIGQSLRVANTVRLLSPFDNAVIQRDRLNDLFGFDYQIECYVPQPKRKYGYYCLPILYGDQFYARVDVKADRKTGVLHLVHLILEDKRIPDAFFPALAKTVRSFAAFNGCSEIRVNKVSPISKKLLIDQLID
jgi:uncharacterized protein YcaQ